MVISFIYSILHGVKSEAKEAAGSDEKSEMPYTTM